MLAQLGNGGSKALVVRETGSNEILATRRDGIVLVVGRKNNLVRVEHGAIRQNPILRESIPKRTLTKQHLIKYYANRPDVNLVADAHVVFRKKTLGRQVPVRSGTL